MMARFHFLPFGPGEEGHPLLPGFGSKDRADHGTMFPEKPIFSASNKNITTRCVDLFTFYVQ